MSYDVEYFDCRVCGAKTAHDPYGSTPYRHCAKCWGGMSRAERRRVENAANRELRARLAELDARRLQEGEPE